jgi:hypothetical protein
MPTKLIAIVFTVVLLAPGTVLACPVCFGNADGPIARGTNLAILALLGVTLTMLGSFAAFFIYLAKRARLARQGQDYAD